MSPKDVNLGSMKMRNFELLLSNSYTMKRLALIEDDLSIRESLKIYIESKSNFEIISQSDSVEDFLALQLNYSPQILLLDVGLPGMNGIEGIPHIKDKHPNVEIIMLTTYEEDDVIFAALCAGATSYISKRTSIAKILEALHIVELGGSYMSPSIAKKIASSFNQRPQKDKINLSTRQREIVDYIVEGLTYNEIAEKCFISLNTVRTHIRRIYSILEINNKTVLIKKYLDGEI